MHFLVLTDVCGDRTYGVVAQYYRPLHVRDSRDPSPVGSQCSRPCGATHTRQSRAGIRGTERTLSAVRPTHPEVTAQPPAPATTRLLSAPLDVPAPDTSCGLALRVAFVSLLHSVCRPAAQEPRPALAASPPARGGVWAAAGVPARLQSDTGVVRPSPSVQGAGLGHRGVGRATMCEPAGPSGARGRRHGPEDTGHQLSVSRGFPEAEAVGEFRTEREVAARVILPSLPPPVSPTTGGRRAEAPPRGRACGAGGQRCWPGPHARLGWGTRGGRVPAPAQLCCR